MDKENVTIDISPEKSLLRRGGVDLDVTQHGLGNKNSPVSVQDINQRINVISRLCSRQNARDCSNLVAQSLEMRINKRDS